MVGKLLGATLTPSHVDNSNWCKIMPDLGLHSMTRTIHYRAVRSSSGAVWPTFIGAAKQP